MIAVSCGAELRLLDPGTRLGPYTIVELVAVGGMGEVYRAEDERLHRDVAIKVLPSHLASDLGSLDRFQREARAVASLSHPNILSIFDYGEEDGVQYAVTEMLEGETLRARLGRGRLTPREALDVMLGIADGVAAAHARGIVHRDLKPENIFITSEGRVKVLDFGLARGGTGAFAARRASAPPIEALPTEPGIVLGTIGYLAPEQVEARTPTPATDVFALGCILFELIHGDVPFGGTSNVQAMVAVLHDTPPHLDDPRIDAIVQRSLAKSPHERFANAGELARAIRGVWSAEAGPPLSKRRPGPPHSKTLLALLVIVVIATAAWLTLRHRNRLLDHGFDLRASDVRGDRETTRLFALALRADAEGNRQKAMQLLEEAWRRPSKTALPAAFLASYNTASGNEEVAQDWRAKALRRLDGAAAYESLLVRYLTGPSGYSTQELALAKSLLEIRPEAWRLRLGAAHIHLGHRERDAARRELQQVDPSKPDDRRLMLVLADRASLGDVDAVERDLRASRLVRRPPIYHYTEGRIAWSRGNALRAMQLYDRAATEAAAEGLAPLEVEARLLAGIAAIRLRRWDDAQQRLATCGVRARQASLEHRVFESAAFSAYAAHHSGDSEERDHRLREAAALQPPAEPFTALRLLAMRMRSPAWAGWSMPDLESDPASGATLLLLRAREAALAGEVEHAKLLLRRARAEGIERAEHREEAELLAAELGLPSTLLPADPPYPNMLRYLAVFDHHERISIGTGASR
jgi:serine/threonine protein kinase